jgi:hypothetical protein
MGIRFVKPGTLTVVQRIIRLALVKTSMDANKLGALTLRCVTDLGLNPSRAVVANHDSVSVNLSAMRLVTNVMTRCNSMKCLAHMGNNSLQKLIADGAPCQLLNDLRKDLNQLISRSPLMKALWDQVTHRHYVLALVFHRWGALQVRRCVLKDAVM